jgi:ribosomal protein S17E
LNLYLFFFTENFAKNKEIVDKYAKIPSKKLRNAVIGQIVRLAKKHREEEKVEVQ